MKTIRSKLKKKFEINVWQSVLLLLAAACAATLMCFVLHTDGLHDMLLCLRDSYLLTFVLNLAPVLLMMLALFFISANPVIAAGLTGFFAFAISMINRSKINLRYSPLMLSDAALVRELLAVSEGVGAGTVILAAGCVLAVILAAAVLLYMFRFKKIGLLWRISGCAAAAAAFLLLNATVYGDAVLYDSFHVVGSDEKQINHFNSKGLIYSMLFTYNSTKITTPPDYNAADIQAFLNRGAAPDAPLNFKPDVVVVMGEAFSDLSDNEAFDFTNFTDPLENYHQIKEDALSGYIVVPSFGGGTSETEFDFITGINSRLFRNSSHAYSLVKRDIDSTARYMRREGYYAEALHPGEAWFYGRTNAFKFIGFERFLYVELFGGVVRKGPFFSEDRTMEFFMVNYSEFRQNNPDTPYYGFLITVQNHGPYKNKYGAAVNFETALPLDEDETNMISNYFEGVTDADRALRSLIDGLELVERPVMLVYFGDHLPGFTANYPAKLVQTGDDEMADHINIHIVPYIIWQNQAYRKIDDFRARTRNLTADESFSSFYLSAYAFDLAGLNGNSNYFRYLRDTMDEYPVVLENAHAKRDRQLYPNRGDAGIELMKNIQYYKLFDEKDASRR